MTSKQSQLITFGWVKIDHYGLKCWPIVLNKMENCFEQSSYGDLTGPTKVAAVDQELYMDKILWLTLVREKCTLRLWVR